MRRLNLLLALFLMASACSDESQGEEPLGWTVMDAGVFTQDSNVQGQDALASDAAQDLGMGDGQWGTDGDSSPSDVGSPDGAMIEPDAVVEEDAPVDPGPAINEGWIGGSCAQDADCDFAEGFCFTEDQGFPSGMCSVPCDLYCPDEEGMVMSFCIGAESAEVSAPPGLCTTRCSFEESDWGCRLGYQCAMLPRFNDPATVVQACIPESVSIPEPIEPSSCQEQLFEAGVSFTQASNPMESPEGFPDLICDIQDPILIGGVIHGVSYRYASLNAQAKSMFVSCELGLALSKMSKVLAENNVTDVIHSGTYNCRVIGGTSKLSQHGLANALDVAALVTSAGDYFEVLADWEFTDSPVTEAGSFLKWFAEEMYIEWIFNIILTPNYNAAHADHFHLDLTPGAHSLQ